MIRLIVFLVVAVGLSLLATWFADHPGRVSLIWQGVQIETSVAVLVVGGWCCSACSWCCCSRSCACCAARRGASAGAGAASRTTAATRR